MNLENVKLVPHEHLAQAAAVEEAVELAVQQAVGWGVNRYDSLLLRLAYEYEHVAKEASGVAELQAELDDARRTIKGLQLQNGQIKKRERNAKEAAETLKEALAISGARVQELENA